MKTQPADKYKISTGNADFLLLNISENLNNNGVSFDREYTTGDFDGCGASYPAEELPRSDTLATIDEVPFLFPSKDPDKNNNMILSGQLILVEKGFYNNLFLLGAVDGQLGESCNEEITVSFYDGTYESVPLQISNWLLRPQFNERGAFICSHLHFSDKRLDMSKINTNLAFIDYELFTEIQKYKSSICFRDNEQNIDGSIRWKPKIWLQSILLPFAKPIVALTFGENCKCHIFSMTLSIQRT